MNNKDMLKILSNFDNVDSSTDTSLILNEGLDKNQRKVRQMPGKHRMKKSTSKKHPASGYLVGGKEGNEEEMIAELEEDTLNDKNFSLSDIFKSLEDAEKEKETNLKKELQQKMNNSNFRRDIQQKNKKELKKTDNGKYELDESEDDMYFHLESLLKNLCFFREDVKKEFEINNGDTFIVLSNKIIDAVKKIRNRK